MAMLHELDMELFPPRHLFLLTADLSGIELEHAQQLLNDLSAEKEAEILREFLEKQGNMEEDEDRMDYLGYQDSGDMVFYEKQGIKTDLFAIEKYIDEVYSDIETKRKPQFLEDAFKPFVKDAEKTLSDLQNCDLGSYDHFEPDLSKLSVLKLDVYLDLEKKRKESGYNIEKIEKFDTKQQSILKESEHIHNKALFDATNESLIQFKPYGKEGEPMPWSRKQRKLQKTPLQKEIDLKKMFEIVKHDVFRWSIMQAGTLPR